MHKPQFFSISLLPLIRTALCNRVCQTTLRLTKKSLFISTPLLSPQRFPSNGEITTYRYITQFEIFANTLCYVEGTIKMF